MTHSLVTLFFNLFTFLFLIYLVFTPFILNSVLVLIIIAVCFSIYLIGLGAVFLGLLYLAIYIGAVTVFFLFVVMMTDLTFLDEPLEQSFFKINDLSSFLQWCNDVYIMPIYTFTITYVFLYIIHTFTVLQNESFFEYDDFILGILNNQESNLAAVAKLLFNEHLAPFLLLGTIILVTLIGAIFLTAQVHESGLIVDYNNLTLCDFQTQDFGGFLFKENRSQDLDDQLVVDAKTTLKLNSTI